MKIWTYFTDTILRFETMFGKMIAIVLRHLPERMHAVALERGLAWGVLDYKNSTLYMTANGLWEIQRLHGCKKEPETVAWLETIPKDGVLYDIGANVGAYSLIAASRGAVVYAFEPGYATFSALCENILKNNLQEKIIPLFVPLSSKTEITYLCLASRAAGASQHKLGGEGVRLGIPAYTLDEFRGSMSLLPPTHIKIDVDDAEEILLKGAEATFKGNSVKSVLIETREGNAVLGEIESYGFVLTSKHKRGAPGVYNYIFSR